MAAGVETQRSEAHFAVRGHVRAFKSGPAIAGSPHSKVGFAVRACYSRSHFASLRAQYVTMISAHGRLIFFVFFALLQLRELIRRNVIVPLPGNSWEGKLIARRKLRCSICGCWAGPACEERELLFL